MEEELQEREKEEEAEYEKINREEEKGKSAVAKDPFSPERVARFRKDGLPKLKRDMRKLGRWRKFPDDHYDYYHAGGNVVFSRRRLEDVPEFIHNLDRFWVDWVSYLSIVLLPVRLRPVDMFLTIYVRTTACLSWAVEKTRKTLVLRTKTRYISLRLCRGSNHVGRGRKGEGWECSRSSLNG